MTSYSYNIPSFPLSHESALFCFNYRDRHQAGPSGWSVYDPTQVDITALMKWDLCLLFYDVKAMVTHCSWSRKKKDVFSDMLGICFFFSKFKLSTIVSRS